MKDISQDRNIRANDIKPSKPNMNTNLIKNLFTNLIPFSLLFIVSSTILRAFPDIRPFSMFACIHIHRSVPGKDGMG